MTSLSMLPGNQNPIDPRVIPHEFHVRPISRAHERRDPPSLAGAHLHEQPAARFEPPPRPPAPPPPAPPGGGRDTTANPSPPPSSASRGSWRTSRESPGISPEGI